MLSTNPASVKGHCKQGLGGECLAMKRLNKYSEVDTRALYAHCIQRFRQQRALSRNHV